MFRDFTEFTKQGPHNQTFMCESCCYRIDLETEQTLRVKTYADPLFGDTNKLVSSILRTSSMISSARCPYCGNDEMTEIDPGIADAIQYLWNAGIKTYMCCEGHIDSWYSFIPDIPHTGEEILIRSPFIDFVYDSGILAMLDKLIMSDNAANATRTIHTDGKFMYGIRNVQEDGQVIRMTISLPFLRITDDPDSMYLRKRTITKDYVTRFESEKKVAIKRMTYLCKKLASQVSSNW